MIVTTFTCPLREYLDLDCLINSRDTIKEAFTNVREFNGTVSKKKRKKFIEEFNDPQSNIDIILIQRQAGKEGISLHDIYGDRPRVLMNFGLPTAPTDAIQIEGRIYRLGLIGNAIFEYITLQTNFEQIAFAEKVATRSRTAENLAMGNLARDLETVFIEGYLNATSDEPNLDQGTSGKESDRSFNVISEYDKSKTYYYSQISKTARNKSKEGFDYYSTPEPIGYMIKKWMNIQPGQSILEPSAGHGALARFFDNQTNNVFIEPSYELFSKLKINCKGNIIHDRFENFNIINKFDKIVMNPPYGKNSKIAMEHVEKALKHLRFSNDNCLFAIVPAGNSFDKRLQNYLNEKDNRTVKVTH